MPYKGWNNRKVTEEVSQGFRLPKPSHCPDIIYEIMIKCWSKNVKVGGGAVRKGCGTEGG